MGRSLFHIHSRILRISIYNTIWPFNNSYIVRRNVFPKGFPSSPVGSPHRKLARHPWKEWQEKCFQLSSNTKVTIFRKLFSFIEAIWWFLDMWERVHLKRCLKIIGNWKIKSLQLLYHSLWQICQLFCQLFQGLTWVGCWFPSGWGCLQEIKTNHIEWLETSLWL